MKDLAALNKVEMLPWDEWGRMIDAYAGKTGADYDSLLDTLATTCAHEDLRVPPRADPLAGWDDPSGSDPPA